MSGFDIASLIQRAKANEIGESLEVLFTRPSCRISLVARNNREGLGLFLEVVAIYNLPLSPIDLASRRVLVRRLGPLGFQLVQENGSKVYELKVRQEELENVMTALLKGWC
jgi:hypothetical protein